MRRDDELDPLRAAWRELDAPDPERPLDEPDEATRATLDWMRAAWERVEPPPVRVPDRQAPSPRAPRWGASRWIPLAAAAGIGALLLWIALGTGERATEGEALVAIGAPEPEAAPGAREESVRPAPAAAEEPEQPPPVEVAALSPGRMELRSGSVRLILLTENTGLARVR